MLPLPRRLKRWFHRFTLADQSYRFLFEPGPEDEVVAVDCETTGLDVSKDDIITIAAVKVRGNRILTSEKFVAVARPEAKMNAEAIKVHRLLESDVEGGERIRQIMRDFLHFVGGRPLVGYYLEFDVAMTIANARKINPQIKALQVSARTGEGMEAWVAWLTAARAMALAGHPLGTAAE